MGFDRTQICDSAPQCRGSWTDVFEVDPTELLLR